MNIYRISPFMKILGLLLAATVGGLEFGVHTLVITVRGDSSGSGHYTDLDAFTEHFGAIPGEDRPAEEHDRVLVLRWNPADDEWLLIEDEEAREFYLREAASEGRGS